ncbi:YkuS family protein [Bacillus sp. BGMRC 2118]|nr:YkuS family protein [Bacillus sp. BGMRC 2118]
MARIGVEQSLTDVREALQEKGYDIVDLQNENDAKNCDCCVVTGMDSNIMGVESSFTAGPVIQASGLSADEICNQVESKLNNQ